MSYYQKHVFVCTNLKDNNKKCCAQGNDINAAQYIKSELKTRELYGPNKIRVSRSGCLGRCALGPCLVVYPDGVWYTYRTHADLDEIIEHHLIAGQSVARLILAEPKESCSSGSV